LTYSLLKAFFVIHFTDCNAILIFFALCKLVFYVINVYTVIGRNKYTTMIIISIAVVW